MPDSETAGYERKDFNPRAIMWAAVALVVALIVTFVGIRIFESALAGGRPGQAAHALAPQANVAPPRLQTNPAADLAELRAGEEARLQSYGWVDRKAGSIHIPIERAMELTAERGLPAREAKKRVVP